MVGPRGYSESVLLEGAHSADVSSPSGFLELSCCLLAVPKGELPKKLVPSHNDPLLHEQVLSHMGEYTPVGTAR